MADLLPTLGVIACYLVVLRTIDLNEREPWWALLHFLTLGTLATLVLNVAVDPALLTLSVWPGAAWRAVTIGAAMALGVAMLAGFERYRGWPELNDLMDGLVYGAATGLGAGVAEALQHQLAEPSLVGARLAGPPLVSLASLALSGLVWGLCGAAIGVGMGFALLRLRTVPGRIAALLAGLAASTGIGGLYEIAAHEAPLTGSGGLTRAWITLLLPLGAVMAAACYAILVERHAIARELQAEVDGGRITARDVRMLLATGARHAAYARDLLTGRWRHLARHVALHNRLVQIALVRSALGRAPGRRRRDALEASLSRLRDAVQVITRAD